MKTPNPPSAPRCAAAAVACMGAILLSGCRLPGQTPPWVANPKATYPESAYLAAVGEGDTRSAAENAAAANLSRIFEVHIEADERMLDQVRETGSRLERTTDFTADITILSAQTLYNIQHAEAWKDDCGRYHAIAYLERGATAALYRGKIEALSARIEFLLSQADAADNPLAQYACLRAARSGAAENRLLLAQLKVIHPASARMVAPPYAESELEHRFAAAAKAVRVGVSIKGDVAGRIGTCLASLLTRYGFTIGSPAILQVDGEVSVSDTGERTANLAFVRYLLAVQMQDPEGNILATLSEKGREGHVSVDEARIRAFRTMESAIRAKGEERLDAFFDSLATLP